MDESCGLGESEIDHYYVFIKQEDIMIDRKLKLPAELID